MPTIAVDAMGGAGGPDEVVRGVAQASLTTDIDCVLVGDERRIQDVLEQVAYNPEQIAIHHAPNVIGPAEEPHDALRAHKDASLVAGLRAVAEERADALVTAGNTPAALLGCAKHLRLLPGVARAALASVYPRQTEHPGQDPLALLVDVGATVRCQAEDLVQFALMGSAYARRISKVSAPLVGLVNMERAPVQAGDVLADAHRRLEGLPGLAFVGDVEGQRLLRGHADVLVCEGLLGNVLRSCLAGVAELLVQAAGGGGERKAGWRFGLGFLAQGGEGLRALTDYSRYGGAPILGFEQVVLTCEGRAGATAVTNAVKVAAKAVRDRVTSEIADAIAGARRPR